METFKRILKWLISDWIKVQEDKALHENRLFWLVVLAPLVFIAWIVYRLTEELITKGLYNPNVSSESLANFALYYAFPITLLTVPLTLAVMINRFHSSKQKAKSNLLVEQNNAANNYFNHFDSYNEYIKKLENEDSISTFKVKISPQISYAIFFKSSSINSPCFLISLSIIDEFIKQIDDEVKKYKIYLSNEVKGTYTIQFKLAGFSHRNWGVNNDNDVITLMNTYYSLFQQITEFHGATNSSEANLYLESKYDEIFRSHFKYDSGWKLKPLEKTVLDTIL
ncbi:hypothetical protein [Pseudoalteromonas rhizosphaerae]|uniref:hypothetical protein n=1 Tax=Pseudoalteromonas rhizosphaerae TaxID=2518973 RepID=UPI00214990F3|nr:hypothetical protein [Pseudoalteromonas rhizosphaerae]